MYKHTIKNVREHTGLKPNFIRRCLTDMRDIFASHISKGANNSLLFDDNALVLFDKIKQLKEDKITIPQIREKLRFKPDKPDDIGSKTTCQTLQNGHTKPTKLNDKSDDKNSVKALYERLLEEKEHAYQTILKEKEQTYKTVLEEKDKTHNLELESLKTKLYLLTDGRDPDEIKRIEIAKQEKRKLILNQLEEIEGKWFKQKEKKN